MELDLMMLYEDFDDLPRDCEVPFENMIEDEYLYRLMNSEDPMYIGPEINVDYIPDWD